MTGEGRDRGGSYLLGVTYGPANYAAPQRSKYAARVGQVKEARARIEWVSLGWGWGGLGEARFVWAVLWNCGV